MGKNVRRILLTGIFVIGLWANTITGLAAELTVTVEAAKIRAEASITSEAVGSAEMGKTFTSEGEAADSSGQVWYRVAYEGNNYGYIRSDLVEVSGGGALTATTATEATVATPVEPRAATISQRSTNVRTGASTSHAQIVSLSMDTAITVVGEAPDGGGDNRKWYEVVANVDGEEIKGFVREDMVNLGEVLPPAEGEVTEPVPAEGEDAAAEEIPDSGAADSSQDVFFVTKKSNEQGETIYYLNNRGEGGGMMPAQELWDLPDTVEAVRAEDQKAISQGKTIIIILAVIIFILTLVVTVLLFKIRDLYDYDDDEEDSVMARQKTGPGIGGFGKSRESGGRSGEASLGRTRRSGEPASGQGRRPGEPGTGQGKRPGEPSSGQGRRSGEPPTGQNRRPGEPPAGQNRRPGEPAAGQNRRPGEPSSGGPKRPGESPAGAARPLREQEGQRVRRPADPELRAAERNNRPEQPDGWMASARKPQNFLHDDDEFEFEFLNMDDKE